jgi:ribosomal protein S18 acetylase RimI-like enzyme
MLVEAVNWDPTRSALSVGEVRADAHLASYVEDWPRQGELGVIARDDDGAELGAAWLRFFTAARPGYGFVDESIPELSIGVVAARRGKGVGAELLDDLHRRAAAAGLTAISLSVERANPAQALYRRFGYRVVESGSDADTMRLDLAEASFNGSR